MRARARLVLLPTLLTTACVDCGDLDRNGGPSKAGYFTAEVRDIPVGAQLDFKIQDWEFLQNPDTTEVRDVASSRPEVLAIESAQDDGRVRVRGVAPGDAEVTFNADADGEALDDAFDIRVAAPHRLEFETCSGIRDSWVVVRGRSAAIPFLIYDDSNLALGGYGVYPVAAQPEAAATLDPTKSAAGWLHFEVTNGAPSMFQLQSTLPMATTIDVRVLESTQDVTVSASPDGGPHYAGEEASIGLQAYARGEMICAGESWRLEVKDPDVCKLLFGDEERDRFEGRAREVAIRFLKKGACEVIYGLLGVAAADTLTIEVENRPSTGGGSSGDFDFD